ncbi:MAG: hypothetical protein JO141_30380, partial [Bradyrhizobium sp.]|nr:hypothetical protein [Bradyrhizobium sp.]
QTGSLDSARAEVSSSRIVTPPVDSAKLEPVKSAEPKAESKAESTSELRRSTE